MNGPKVLKLRGNFVHEGNYEDGEYERLIINRDDLLKQFEKIISMAEQLSEDNLYLYHIGI